MVGIVALVGLGVWLVPKLLDEAGISGDAWTFKETLPEMVDDFGEDAKVVSISDGGGAVSYAVIGDNGQVQERRYFVEVEDLPGSTQGRTRKTEDSERAATPEETSAATVTLGSLDEDVVEQMWKEVDFPNEGSAAALTGSEWALSSGARPFDQYLANADGSNIRQTKSKEDTFGTTTPGGTTKPPDAQSQIDSAKALGDCITAAGGDIAAIQKCQATAQP